MTRDESRVAGAQPRLSLPGAPDTVAELRPTEVAGSAPRRQLAPSAEASKTAPAVTGSVRNVTPDGFTTGPTPTGPLERVAQSPAPEAAEPAPAASTQRLFNPMVTSAGVLKIRDREIRLAGIDAPDFQQRCGDDAGSWPCGRMARAALQRFIRGRAVECAVPAGADAIPDPAACSVAGANLAEWLVMHGWAKQAHADYASLEDRARQAKLGLWAEMRPDLPVQGQPAALAIRAGPSAPDSAAPMRARLSTTP